VTTPEPLDDEFEPEPEIRGGDRPSDYVKGIDWLKNLPGTLREADGEFTGVFEPDGCPGHDEPGDDQ
jgi:hypothetical protein